jgi:hypothetical protein
VAPSAARPLLIYILDSRPAVGRPVLGGKKVQNVYAKVVKYVTKIVFQFDVEIESRRMTGFTFSDMNC